MKYRVHFLLIGMFLRSACAAGFTSTIPIECTRPRGHICVIKSLPPTDGAKTSIAFPDLSKRTTLRILEGTLNNLTREQTLQLHPVRNLEMERLGLKSVFIDPEFEKLHLRDNQITTLVTKSTSNFALKLLDVRKNLLRNVSLLEHFDQLEQLYLDDNQINQLSVDMFAKMQNLRVLSAAANGMMAIVPPTRVLVLSKLESLFLGRNGLKSIEMEKWQLPSLRRLQLHNNNLVELTGMDEFDQFYDLMELKLAGNRWSCGWLQHALANVTVKQSSNDNEGVVLDKDTDCSIENVLGICCSFTPNSKQEEQRIFQPEINQVRDAIRQINTRHDAFIQHRNEKLKELKEDLQRRVDNLRSFLADQEDELERGKIQATQILKKIGEAETKSAQQTSDVAMASNIEQQRKQLVHFMVDMKNKLHRQANDADSLWVQANVEKISLEQREKGPLPGN